MSHNGIRRKPAKPKIELMLLADERCVLVRRGKRIYKFQVTADGSHLCLVGAPPKKMAGALEKHLGALARALKVRRKFLRRSITTWASRPGVFQDLEFEIPG